MVQTQTPDTDGGDAARIKGVEERGLAREELRGDSLFPSLMFAEG